MIRASDIYGVMGMMPAFGTDDSNSPRAKNTVHVPELERAVDRAVRDGLHVIATTGTFGECHTLLWQEFTTLVDATISAVHKRIPVIIGCTSLHTREVLLKMEYAAKAGADGVLVGVPFYFTVKVEGFDLEISNFRGPEFIDAWDASFGGLMQTKGKGDHPYVSVPAFPNRKFRLAYIFVNNSAGSDSPRDLEGKRVFVRYYAAKAELPRLFTPGGGALASG